MDEIRQESDGTWTVAIDIGKVKPITGIPTRELAERICDEMWNMEKAGADNYAASEW